MSTSCEPVWCVLGASVRGAAHVRAQRPNQDSIAWRAQAGPHDPVVLAIADGHGSARYFRSHNGAKLAVRVAVDLLWEFSQNHAQYGNLSAVKRLATDRLPRDLVLAWRAAVDEHLELHPFSATEETSLASSRHHDPYIAYGATVIALLAAPSFLLFLQLGDGDILLVDQAHNVARPPLPHDPRLLGNQTTSLCGQSAWRDVRTVFRPNVGEPPALVLLSTDGYANSFADESGFFAAAADVAAALQTDGDRAVAKRLPGWLRATSAAGSGDDITLGLLYHP